ncbi:MAG: polysaccharide biosynthesis C-terminal domain-containing protein [Candidatus Kapabacteria bacterium]|nr:polysaccharide biosynthesis C-terminal domain-containing protein [Ignavibacteriota bacterium]MCW5885815.1 polysaccharide biosynthesis C-terminal domain-containing protein [Candidatus Kapabacteria bacterium]
MYSKIKKLGSDTLIYGFATVFGRFLNFLLTPIYSNLLFGTEYEFIIYIYALLAFINVIYSFGMESAFFRFYSHDNKEQASKVFTHSFLIINIISVAFTAIILISSDFIASIIANPEVTSAAYLIRLAALIPMLDAAILIPMGYMRMTNQAKKFATIRFSLIFLTVAFNLILLIGFELQAEGVLYAQLIASSIGVIYLLPMIVKKFLAQIDNKLFIRMLKFGLPTIPANLAAIILQVADRPILTELTDSFRDVVTYQVNYRLGIPMMIFVTVFEYAWKPFYLSHFKDSHAKELFARIFTYFTLAAALIFLTISMFIGYIVRIPGIGGEYFINPEYWSGMHIIPIILFAYYFNGVFTNLSAGLLIEKKTQYLPLAVGIAALVNIAVNFVLIPKMGYEGAAWATLAAYFVSVLIIYFIVMKIFPVNYEWRRVALILVATAGIFFTDKYLTGFIENNILIVFKVSLLIIFFCMLYLFKFFGSNEIEILKKFIKK